MTCPYLHELSWRNRVTMRQELVELTVPGMKLHIRRVHGEAAYRRIKWPPLHAGPVRRQPTRDSIATMTLNELRREAKRLGIDSQGMSKYELGRAIIRHEE
jgi:hypothetical protein